MKIVVCIRQMTDGEINPFDACAYESALEIENAEITLLSMGPKSAESFLHQLTRRGAKNAILLSDSAFAGADTLATAHTLSLAIERIKPDLVICGRQTLVGDTGQVGPMLSVKLGFDIITNVMEIKNTNDAEICCLTRSEGECKAKIPALVTIERINTLRLPSIRSKLGEISVWSASDIGADINKCGLTGSPTRVLSSTENQSGKRKCRFITMSELEQVVNQALSKNKVQIDTNQPLINTLNKVLVVGESALSFAKTISEDITVIEPESVEKVVDYIKTQRPNVVLWPSDDKSKRMAAQVAAKLDLGLCADCTRLETDGNKLFMYRPALSGSVIAKIESLTCPAMATVRTTDSLVKDVFVAVGYGAKDSVEKVKELAQKFNAELASSRKAVDNSIMPYSTQVGLTGRTVAPPVYIAIGVSGAVHHIVGMQRAGTVIAINPDKSADIFEYADYGILEEF